jgi:hypothetical protein
MANHIIKDCQKTRPTPKALTLKTAEPINIWKKFLWAPLGILARIKIADWKRKNPAQRPG